MSRNCEDPTKRSGKADVRTNPAKDQPVTSTSIHGRNTLGQNIPHDSDNSSDFDVWVAPNISDVKPDQGAIPKVKPAGGIFQKAWKDVHVSIKRKEDMKILEQCSCKESDLPPVKMQYLLNFHFKELETALCDELLKLKWNVKCVIPGDQCLSIEVKNYTDERVLENVILLLSDELYKVNYFQSMQASKHPELLLKEYIDRGYLAIYVDDEKVFVVGMVDNPKKVTEMLRKKPTSSDYSSTSAYKMDVQLDNPFKCRLLIYLQFIPTMRQKHLSVNVVIDEERSIMSICGNNLVDVHAAVEDVDIFIKDFTVEDIELEPLLMQLLKLPDIQTFLKKLCEEQELKVIWTLSEFNNCITCHCKNRKAVQDFSDVLKHNLEKKTYRYSKQSFGDKTMIFSTTNMFSDFLKKYDGKRLVSTVEGNSMHIFTTRDIGTELTFLEVTFKGTKTDIQKNLTQNEKKEIHDQKSEVTITDDGIEWIDGTKRRLNVEDIFHVVRGKINPSLKLENEVRAECIKQNMKYDEDTMEVEGTLEQLTSLRQYLITRFGVKRGLVNIEQKQETLPRKMHQASHPNQQAGDIECKSKIKLTDMEYKMLKFYCPESQVFKRKCKYENDMLIIYPGTNETEQEFQLTIQSKLTHFNSMTCFEVVPQDTTIDDDQLCKIEQEIPPSIFWYLSKDRKTLTLKGSSYEKLSVAKNKSEVILGLQKKNNNARRNRVLNTDPNYESRKDKTPENRSFHQSINNSRSSSESFSGSSSTYNSSTVKDLSYLTPEGLVVKVYVGNILRLNVDCIVNAANENLMHGAGVASVISRAAGYDFQKESDDYIQNNGPLRVTECCTTLPGKLQQYQYVIHVVGPKWYDYPYDKRACADDLQKAIVNCFKEAEIQNVSSVALPMISSGIFGVPKEVCCSQYCKAVIEYSNDHGKTTCLKEIHFMDKEPGMIQMIQAEFSLHLNMTQLSSVSGNTSPGTTGRWSRDGKCQLSWALSDDSDRIYHHDNPSSGNSENNTDQATGSKFKKQYMAAKELRINIVQEDITKIAVDIIVCPQDDLCLCKGAIAKAISKVTDEWYRAAVLGMKRVNKCEIKKLKASPASLPFKGVLHTVAPRWDNHAIKDNKTFQQELSLTIRNIIQHCSDSGTVNSVAIPVLGIGADGNQTPYVTYASILANEISTAMKSDRFSLTEIYIVTHEWSMASAIADHFDKGDSFKKVTSFKGRNRNKDKKVVKAGDKEQSKDDFQASGNRGDVKLSTTTRHGGLEDCVICMDKPTDPRKLQCGHIFCEECIGQQFKVKPVCPTCGFVQGIMTGDQPPGQIKVISYRTPLPGYPQCGRIHIEYTIYGGQQGAKHPNPGRCFEGIKKTAYLPDNTRGRLIAKLLKVAFERKLVFTIGLSLTMRRQLGVVTWNDISHKTNPYSDAQFGYPDTTYFDRVIYELATKGVTEKDLNT